MTTDRRRTFRKARKSRLGLWTALGLALLLGAYVAVLNSSRPHVAGAQMRIDTFVDLAERGRIRSARILDVDSFVVGTFMRGDQRVVYNTPYLKDTRQRLVDVLLENRVPTSIDQQNGKRLVLLASMLLPALILILLFAYMIISYRRGTGLFNIRSGARRMRAEDANVTFADVAGQEGAVTELRELVQFLTDPGRFSDLGATIPKGVLLFGPPGCGKTLLARALAGEAGAAFYSISGADFVELYVGVGAARVRDLFKEARQNAPAIVFIDELDAIGRQRGAGGGAATHGEQEQALNQILTEMDGFSPSEGIILLGATNRPDVLDPALLRPGRFDRTVGLERPGEEDRLAILTLHARGKRLDADVDLAAIARRAIGLSGADLANVMNEGAILAARAGKPAITGAHLDEGLKRMLEAPDRQRRLSMRDRSIGRRATGDQQRVTFADVAGQDAAIGELREIQQFLAEPQRYLAVGASIPKGVLLYGPPGCGKTLLAKALAGEANAAFFSVSASEFVEVFVGRGAGRIRDLFAEARSVPPAIIFIDEIDALAARRTGTGPAANLSGESDQTLNQLLAEMDGFTASEGVIVLAATNRPDALDPALLRPGRFDRTIGLERADEEGRLAILSVHLGHKPLDPQVDLRAIASRAIGLTGADLAGVMNEAALLAARAGRASITQPDLDQALDRILEAPDRQRRLSMRDRSFGRRFSSPEERVTFADVAGVDDAIEELAEVKDYLAQPERFAEMGARIPRGILLVGPPGCGKTLLARAVAGEANATFFSVAASEFVEVFVGEGAARVRDLFAEARALAPSIVFIDELDAVGAQRQSVAVSGNQEREATLNQILVALDGFDPRTGVILMAATNRPDLLDPALVRPGRIDRQVIIDLPDKKGRQAILELYARRLRLSPGVSMADLASLTQGMSGADLANIMNEAALLATRRGMDHIPVTLVDEAIERALLGVGRGGVMSEDERRMVAYHEAGHALVGHVLPGALAPYKLSIVSRGHTLGAVWKLDSGESDRTVHTRSTLIDQMAASLGGRVAEELVFGEQTSAAASDLSSVSTTARRMVAEWGMGQGLGPVSFPNAGYGSDWGRGQRQYSERITTLIDAEVQRLVEEANEQARTVLVASRAALDRVAVALLERETLSAEQFEQVVGPGPVSRSRKQMSRAVAPGD
ncbi:MAG: AAA family ATPase [Acidimicrobiales bacterium]